MVFLAVSIQSDAAKMSSYTNNTTPNGDVYFVGVDPNDISQTANGSNYRYSLDSILNLGLLDAVFNSLSIAGTGDSWIELENNTSFSDSIAGKYGLRFYNGALQQIINGTATDIGSASVIQRSSDPVYTDLSTGEIAVSTSSGDLFIKTSTGMYTFAGSYAADPTPPTFASASIAADGVTVTTGFSEAVSQGAGYSDLHFNIDSSITGPDIGLTYVSGSGTPTWTFTAASTILRDEIVNLDFSGAENSVEDGDGTDMEAVINYAVTNGSTQTGSLYTTAFSDAFTRPDNANVIVDGPGWTSETDTAGICSILSNAYNIAMDGTNGCRISKTIASNNTDYEIKFKLKLADITAIDNRSLAKISVPLQIYTTAGVFMQIYLRTDTSGNLTQIGVSRYNDAGSVQATVYQSFPFVADTYVDFTIQVDIGAPGASDGIIKVVADSTTILDITGLADETRPVATELRFGLTTVDWNQANTLTLDDFIYRYK